MSKPRMAVTNDGSTCSLSISASGGLSESELEARLFAVYEAVNPAAKMKSGEVNAERLQAEYDAGPLLFKVQAKLLEGDGSVIQLGGLKVATTRLKATIDKLRELGFEVTQ